MRFLACLTLMTILLPAAQARAQGLARPTQILEQIVAGLPTADRQLVRVLTATFKPGDRTVAHTHRFPVVVFVLEGAFVLDLAGRAPVVVQAGEAFVEPAGTAMTGYNPSATAPTRVIIVYTSTLETPFLDPLPH